MPRTARIDHPGLLQHVIARGIERREIFHDDDDRREYLRRLGIVAVECELRCIAWALMPNHVHLFLGTGRAPMAVGMARLNTGYAGYFNTRHERIGHLFHNRYRSIPVQDESYFLSLVRYIHLNPLRAGIVPDLAALARHPWTGFAALMGTRPVRFQDVDAVLGAFAADREVARIRLWRWMEQGIAPFPESVGAPEPSIADLAACVAEALGQPARTLRSGERRGDASPARAALAHLACTVLSRGATAVARELGVSHTAIARAARRGAEVVRRNAALARLEAVLRAGRP